MNSSDSVHALRPYGATVLSIVVWVVLGALAIEALFAAGIGGLSVFPGLALIAALVWAVLWAPRLVLRTDEVEVRNLLHTYTLPFARIEAVRLGAMVRFDVDELQGKPRQVTAWNAPGVGRDNPLARVGTPVEGARGTAAVTGVERRRRLSRGERLRRDQESSRSAIVRERWEEWHAQHPAGGAVAARRSVNLAVVSVVGALIVVNAVLLLL